MRTLSAAVLACCILCTQADPALTDPLWLDDTLIAPSAPGLGRITIDVRPDGSALYAHVSGDNAGEVVGWYRSLDAGVTWANLSTATWGINNAVIGAAYGFDVLVQVWQAGGNIWRRTVNAATGAQIGTSTFVNESPLIAREIVVDSNAETIPPGNEFFIACATFLNPTTNQVSIKAYRSGDDGATWGNFAVLDQGPLGDPAAIGDMHFVFSRAGFPYFHVVYRKQGRLYHVRTTNAGVSWQIPTELILNVAATTEVSVAAFGIFAVAAAESPTGQVVYCNTEDAGTTWSPAKLIDGPQAGGRRPFVAFRGAYQVFYRQPDDRIATRFTTTPDDPMTWTAEEYASLGTTDHPSWAVGWTAGEIGAAYVRSDDGGRPYFISLTGTPAAIDDVTAPAAASLLDVFPTPSAGPFHLVWGADAGAPLAGEILNVAGRRVAPLSAWSLDGRGYVATWNGRDARGHPVPAGIYFARVATPAGGRSARLVVTH